MQVGADPRRRLRRDRSFAEQVDRHAARRARIGIDAARGAVGPGLGIESLDQMRAPYLVAPPMVLLVLAVAETRSPQDKGRQGEGCRSTWRATVVLHLENTKQKT